MDQWRKDARKEPIIIDIDSLVPAEHLLRKIEKVMDYEWLYDRLDSYYCHDNGRPGTDPVVLINMVLIQHLFGIPSLRQTHLEIQVNLAYRWFLGYGLLDEIPHFATVSYAFCKRFPDELTTEIFEHILNKALNNCIIGVFPRFISFFVSAVSRIRENRYFSIVQYFLCDPGSFIASIYCYELYIMLVGNLVIHLVPCYTAMDIACGYFHTQCESSAVAYGMGFIGKLPLMFSLYEHTTVRIGGRYCFFCCSAAGGRLGIVIVVVIFYGVLPQLFAFSIDLSAQLSGIHFCRFLDLFLLVLVFIGTGFDVGTVNEDCAGIYHSVNDTYTCPRGGILRHTTTDRDGKRTYRSTPEKCRECPCKAKCGANEKGQKIYTTHIWQEYMDLVEQIRKTECAKKIYAQRKETIERVFADAKEKHAMRYTHHRGLAAVTRWVSLKYAAMNLKKLANWSWNNSFFSQILLIFTPKYVITPVFA